MRLGPWRIDPSDALRDKSVRARFTGRSHQVPGSLAADAGVSRQRLGHLTGIKARWEVGELMNYDLWASCRQRSRQGLRVEHVNDHRLDPRRAQGLCFRART